MKQHLMSNFLITYLISYTLHFLCAAIVFFCGSLAAQIVIDKIEVGVSPTGIGINPTTNKIYVTNSGIHTVSVIDGMSNEVIDSVKVGQIPKGVDVNSITNRIYVTNSGSNTVSVIDGLTNMVIDTIEVGNSPIGIGVNHITNLVYVANIADNTVSVIDGSINEIIDQIDVSIIREIDWLDFETSIVKTKGILVNSMTNRIYVTHVTILFGGPSDFSNDVMVINGLSNEIIDQINLSSGSGDVFFSEIYGMGVNPTTNHLYAVDKILMVVNSRNYVKVIDILSHDVIANVAVNLDFSKETDDPFGLAVNPSTNHIFVTDIDSNTVSVIDGLDNKIITTIVVGNTPIGIGANPVTNLIYVVNNDSDDVTVIMDNIKGQRKLNVLTVSPVSANSSLWLKDAVVKSFDQNGRPLHGITVTASASDGAIVLPSSVITGIDGAAKFKFRFRFVSKNEEINFTANGLSTTITRKF